MRSTLLWIFCFSLFTIHVRAEDKVLSRTISLSKSKGSVYEMLNHVSEATGMLFIYSSQVIDNDRKARIQGGQQTVRQAILSITGKENLQIKVLGNHILLYEDETPAIGTQPPPASNPKPSFFIIEGQVKCRETKEPLPFASVGVAGSGIGTVTNQNGQFQLKVPDSLQIADIHISYVGYESQLIPAELLMKARTDIYMETRIIPIQEVIVNLVNPVKLIKDMIDRRNCNYAQDPVYMTAFYREGIDRKNGFINLTEAVFKIYKTSFDTQAEDRVKLLKMRKISNKNETDSIIMKMKAGVNASISLDLIKNLPDFLTLDNGNPFNYAKIDMTIVDSRLAHVIAFEQKQGITDPLYKGELYIDAENSALLSAHFEINPEHIKKAKEILVVRQSKNVDITPKTASYTVSYKEWNGKYYLNYLRGDLSFGIKHKNRFLSRATTVNTYFEMVVCKIDTLNVKRFTGKESIPTTKVFSETKFNYDENFWGDFNIIFPEQKLSDDMTKITAKIEESIE